MFLPVGSCIVFLINSSWISDVEHLFSFGVLREGLSGMIAGVTQCHHTAAGAVRAFQVLSSHLKT